MPPVNAFRLQRVQHRQGLVAPLLLLRNKAFKLLDLRLTKSGAAQSLKGRIGVVASGVKGKEAILRHAERRIRVEFGHAGRAWEKEGAGDGVGEGVLFALE